ncbi:MAG: (2Fe-2S)-binding protein [SAR324 cluster bacterium]|nr:(2Fe-2S)-binding protein [SAR324 cluster bacterium]MBL7034115.1 (2Fe-2S)-binding protein [SAR324 cluster bacterium]
MQTLKINGVQHQIDVEDDMPLLWVLRDVVGLTGTKFGCGIGECGACTVHINGAAVRSCSFPAIAAVGAEITTIEGLPQNGEHPVQKAWLAEQVPQCGYCQPGQIMATSALLANNPQPSADEIEANITNLCRCGTYDRVRRGIQHASELIKEKGA